MPALPTGTVTLLFTDIEGSTTLLQRLGDRRYAEVLAEHKRLLRDAFAKGNGQEIDTQGDAFLVAFSRARDAVAAAVAAQRTLTDHSWPDGASLRVRMGLHTGEPARESSDYVGLDVHRAARIAAAGHGGQIIVSDATYGLVSKDLPEGVSVSDLGEHRLKDLAHPHRLFQVLAPDLPVDFPPLRSLSAHRHNLPIQLTSFIGREREMAEVKTMLAASPLVTLTGAGGSGKTRLALQIGADLVEQYSDGVWLVELAALVDPALVPQTVATALGVPEQPNRTLTETLVNALRPKPLLLLLDNCEHLLAGCAGLADTLLRACPNLGILATSREGLGIAGEVLYPIPTFPVPDPDRLPPMETLIRYESVRLFAERATAVLPTFRLTSQNAGPVARICHCLDGIPLAIELAAVRVKTLAVDQIVSRLHDRFQLLTRGSRIAPARHQTLRATIDWSYDLLSEQEQILLQRFSVFAGGFTLEAAEQICAGEGIDDGNMLGLLSRLVDKSLVVFDTQEGQGRYRLLETVRRYSWDRLVETGESEDLRRRHRDWFLALAEMAEPQLDGTEGKAWLTRLETEHDNFRVALELSRTEEGSKEAAARQATALSEFWRMRGHLSEGRRWLEETLSRSGNLSPSLRAKALRRAALLALIQSDYIRAKAALEESLALSRELRDKTDIARSLHRLGRLAYFQDEQDRATALCEESLTIFRELGNRYGIAASLETLGRVAWRQGNYECARRLCEESLAVAREAGDKMRIAGALDILSLVVLYEGNCEKAVKLQEESLALVRQFGDKIVPDSVSILGIGAYYQGDYKKASTLFQEALTMARELDYRRGIAIQLHFLGRVARAQGDYSRAMVMQRESLTTFREHQEKWFILQCLESLAGGAISQNQPQWAARLFGAAEALRETSHIPLPPVDRTAYGRDIAAVRAALGEVSFAVAWTEGRAMTLEQAVEHALVDEAN